MASLAQCGTHRAHLNSFHFPQVILREEYQFYSIKQTLIEHLLYAKSWGYQPFIQYF